MPARRTIWMLKHARAGDLAQMRFLLKILRETDVATIWNAEEKQLIFSHGVQLTPGQAVRAVDRPASGLAVPPWPDAILATEKIATWIGAGLKGHSRSGSRLIVLGRMAGDPAPCDLILSTLQFAQAATSHSVMLPVPLAPAPTATPDSREKLRETMSGRPRPWTVWALGGSVAPDRLDAAAIAALAAAAKAQLARDGGSLLVFTSPRTGSTNAAALRAHLPPQAILKDWADDPSGPNLFPAALAEADRIVVTSDSISMVAEAIDSGKPVALYRLPQSETVALKLGRSLTGTSGLRRLAAPLLRRGIIETPPDRTAFFRNLISRGWLAEYPAFPAPTGELPLRRAERLAVAAIQGLWA